jgi:hypothetical protein
MLLLIRKPALQSNLLNCVLDEEYRLISGITIKVNLWIYTFQIPSQLRKWRQLSMVRTDHSDADNHYELQT